MESSSDRARLAELLSQRQVPLTPNQLSLWAWERLEPGHPALMLSSEWELSTSDPTSADLGPRLRHAFAVLAQRHVNLRTLYPSGRNHPDDARREGPPTPLLWTGELDFEELEVPEEHLELAIRAERESPFELEHRPPLRVRLLRGKRSVLHFKVHHIACDWWSMLLLVEELATLLRGQALPELSVDFPTYARWQSLWLKGPEPDRLLAEWRRELAPPRPELRFAPDFPGPAAFQPGSIPIALPSALARRLRAFAQETGCSLSAVLLAGYGQALAQRSGHGDVIVAMPCGARWRTQFRNLLGPVYNILPLRLQVAGSWRSLARHSAEVLERALTRQELPFPVLVEEMRPHRPHGAFPFTSAALSVLPYHEQWTHLQADGLWARHVRREFLVGPFDFTLNVLDGADDLHLALQYNAGLFSREKAQGLAEGVVLAFEAVATGIVHALPRATQDRRIEDRFAEAAARFGPRVAVVDGAKRATYADLEQESTRLATALSAVPVGQPVGLAASPSLESVLGWLAILKAGRICLPLDPELPSARRQAILADCGCQVILSPQGPADGSGTIAMGGELRPAGKAEGGRAQAAYLLYTSGSQGQPRGVLGSHRGLLHRCDSLNQHFPWQCQERALLRTPLCFVDAVAEWFGPLDAGATLYPFARTRLVDSEELLAFLNQAGITRASLVPSLLGLLLRSKQAWPPSLRLCIASGEVLRPDLVRGFYHKAPFGSVLVNLYGSTECAGDVAWCDTRYVEPGAASVPLGLPLGQSILQVVDRQGRPLDEGEEGEILVAGPGVAHGYWNRLEETRRVFGQPPTLRTGDRGVWSRGLLEFRGRFDQSLKIRGWRVDVQEVEAVLEAVPGIREAVVRPRENEIEAWIGVEADLEVAVLWSMLRQHLAPPLRPARIRRLKELPRLPTGKIDRERLDAHIGELLSPLAGGRDLEQDSPDWRPLAELWEEVLGLPRVGPNDNFFELGGHSLRAVELSERIEEKFGKVMPPGLLVQLPTVALLWTALQKPSPQVLIEMRAGTGVPVLGLIPGAWGGTIGFQKLVAKLRLEQPVVGLEFDGTSAADRANLAAVAARFAAELVRYRPGGPFVICGFSAGGLIAYEMARLLGPQLQHLVLLDTAGPGLGENTTAPWLNRLREVWTHLQLLGRSRPRHVWDRVVKLPARRRRTPSEQLDLALAYLSESRREGGFEGPVTLICMSYQPDWITDPLLGWGDLLPQLRVHTVVGLHGPLVLEEPIVDDVAAELGRIVSGSS